MSEILGRFPTKCLAILVVAALAGGCVVNSGCHGCPPHTDPVRAVIER